jgi:hypothetical protein
MNVDTSCLETDIFADTNGDGAADWLAAFKKQIT